MPQRGSIINQRRGRPGAGIAVVQTIGVAAALLAFCTPGPVGAQPADLSNVNDVLFGKRELARVDDIAIAVVQNNMLERAFFPTENGTTDAAVTLLANVSAIDMSGAII